MILSTMKRFRFILIPALIIGLWQWYRLDQLKQRQVILTTQIAEAKTALAAKKKLLWKKTKPEPIPSERGEAAGPAPLEVREFFDLAAEISEMEKDEAGKEGKAFRQKVMDLFTRLSNTPLERLKVIMEKLPDSSVSPTGKAQVADLIMGMLASSEPAVTASYALQYKARPETLNIAMQHWAKQDPAAAAAWVDKAESSGILPPDLKADQLRVILLPHQIAADPGGEVVGRIAAMAPPGLNGILTDTARILTDAEQRRIFLSRLTQVPGLPADTAARFLREVGRESSFESATNLLKEVGSALAPVEFDNAAVATATARIDANTPAQAAWLLKNLRGPDRSSAINQLITAWTQADFNAAATWLKNQPASPDHDSAISSFAPLVAATEPPSAVDWAATIADPARRSGVLNNLYQEWHHKSPEAAAAYFREKGLALP
jgi:hypothetical protein